MSVHENLAQMVTGSAPQTAPGMPKRGSQIVIDGETYLVSSSAQVAGTVIITAIDAAGAVHTFRRPAR